MTNVELADMRVLTTSRVPTSWLVSVSKRRDVRGAGCTKILSKEFSLAWGSMGADGHFRVTLSIRREPAAGPVYCKMETSARFRQLKTVKLSCEATYRLDISFKPPQLLQSLTIGGKQVEAIERARDGTACAYSAYHSTEGIPASARGHREELQIAMRVLGSGYLATCLQIKYYRADDQSHCEWGSRLHCIELDCSSVEGRLVTVDRETYRKLGIES